MSRCTCLRDSKTTLLSTYDQPKKGNPHRDIRFAPTRIKFRTPKTTHQCSLTWFKKCRETDPPIRLSNGTQTEFPLFFGGFHTFLQDWLGVVLSKCVPFRPGHITTKTYPNLCKLNDFQKTTCFTYNFTSIKKHMVMDRHHIPLPVSDLRCSITKNPSNPSPAFLLLACSRARCWDGNWNSAHRSCSALTNLHNVAFHGKH